MSLKRAPLLGDFSANRIPIPATNHGRMRLRETKGAVREPERWKLSRPEGQNKSSAIKVSCAGSQIFAWEMLGMIKRICKIGFVLCCVCVGGASHGQTPKQRSKSLPLDSLSGLELADAKAEVVNYRGRPALHLIPLPNQPKDYSMLAIVSGTDFQDGTIEIAVAGSPRKDADPTDRGFIGLAFRAQKRGDLAEYFYLRPTNGRADDQLRRNHSVQYVSTPDFPWQRLRQENPGVYESYVDLQTGAWTRMKIAVSGTKARLYVNGADQPCLIVNDLKLGETHGQIILWAYGTTDAYFSNLTVK
jgi:hypothetical protein